MRSLVQFRVDGTPVESKEVPLDVQGGLIFQVGEVMAFDQSIANTGWVHLTYDRREGLVVRSCGSLALPPDGYPKGHEGTLLRADDLGDLVESLLKVPVTTVVHETPPVMIGKMARPESSLVSAAVIRQVARRQGHQIVMVSNQHSKKILTGNGNADKKMWHQAIERFDWSHRGQWPTNEGQRDAMCLALTFLIEKEPE